MVQQKHSHHRCGARGLTMSATTALAAPLHRLFMAAQHKSAQLAQHMHPAWVTAALPGHGAWAMQDGGGPALVRVSLLLGALYGVHWPGLASLRNRAHRVALLSRPLVLRVLAAAALHVKRGAVRHCVGREVRRCLVELVGEPAYAALLDSPDTSSPPAASSLGDLNPEAWATEGYRALHATSAWTCKDASVIARLALAPGAFDESPAAAAAPAQADMTDFLNRLELFFPEQSWLFGSDMDRALSGLQMGSYAAPTLPS
jgi:hypothetical protein